MGELPGKNKNCRLLAGFIYRSEKLLPFNDWLEKFEDTIGYIKTNWDGPIMIAGDINIDLSCPDTNCRNYQGLSKQFNLTHVAKGPTRISQNSATLIEHILISDSELVKCTDILPCHDVSDHDGPYVLLNVRLPKYEPRYKLRMKSLSIKSHSLKT